MIGLPAVFYPSSGIKYKTLNSFFHDSIGIMSS